jgi:RNAse (barnase) inhibitor barstar
MIRYCQVCGCELTTERKYCESCRKARKREYAKQHYRDLIESGGVKKRYGMTTCVYCGKEIVKNRPDQDTCFDCYKEHLHKTVENYNKVKRVSRNGKVLMVGRSVLLDLGFKLGNLVVHHIDENPDNNTLSNLMVLSKKNHASLHRILEKNWSLLSKDSNSNLEDCWDTLRGQLTTAYLETKGANVIKITDIGRSAAELLNEENIYIFDPHEEGSETMHQAPKSD